MDFPLVNNLAIVPYVLPLSPTEFTKSIFWKIKCEKEFKVTIYTYPNVNYHHIFEYMKYFLNNHPYCQAVQDRINEINTLCHREKNIPPVYGSLLNHMDGLYVDYDDLSIYDWKQKYAEIESIFWKIKCEKEFKITIYTYPNVNYHHIYNYMKYFLINHPNCQEVQNRINEINTLYHQEKDIPDVYGPRLNRRDDGARGMFQVYTLKNILDNVQPKSI